jgi:hypothetical protein
MRCTVIKQFNRRGVLQLPGSIINIPEDTLHKLAGFVQAITETYSGQGCRYYPKICKDRYSCHGSPCDREKHFSKNHLPCD